MSRRSVTTNITPLPRAIARDTAVALLHDHASMIELNPLVIRHATTDPPANASPDEAESGTWYEITDLISLLPGGAMKSEVSYKACFYNLPRGLQTHVFAPAGLDMKSKWLVCGNMPGEPREPLELGADVPREGLYIREDVDMRCNVFLTAFVKRNLKRSHQVVVDKILEKAAAAAADCLAPASAGGASRRAASRSMEDAPSGLSHMTSVPPEMTTRDQHRHLTRPLHCACNGPMHDPSCLYCSPDDFRNVGLGLSISPPESHAVPAIPLVSPTSSRPQAPPPPGDHLPPSGPPVSELYGSARPGQCLCAGALHDISCPSYPGLRGNPERVHLRSSDNPLPPDSTSARAQSVQTTPPLGRGVSRSGQSS